MTTDRRYCRFSDGPAARAFGMPEVPKDGMCLCAFVVISSKEHPTRVLMGKLNPAAPWDHLGALDPERVATWKDRWMLPSCHLLLLESPADAAARILRELTPLSPRPLQGPQVTSEVYVPQRHPGATHHWDLEFIFRGEASDRELRPMEAWNELSFVDTGSIASGDMARAQGDILAEAGFALRPGART